jgi:hypothetical protein
LLKGIRRISPGTCKRAVGVSAPGKIDAADTSLSGMGTVSRSGHIVIGVENVPAMAAPAHASIDDEGHDNGAGRTLTVGNVLCPTLRDYAITTDSAPWIASIATVMPDGAASLLTTMISRS